MLTKSEGGLNLLHEADDDAVIRLESTATAALAANNNQLTNCAFLCSEKDDGGRGGTHNYCQDANEFWYYVLPTRPLTSNVHHGQQFQRIN